MLGEQRDEKRLMRELNALDEQLRNWRPPHPAVIDELSDDCSDIHNEFIDDSLSFELPPCKVKYSPVAYNQKRIQTEASSDECFSAVQANTKSEDNECDRSKCKLQKNGNSSASHLSRKTSKYSTDVSLECTFKPKILKKSQDLQLGPVLERLSAPPPCPPPPYKEKVKKKEASPQRIAQLSRPKQRVVESAPAPRPCFQPKLSEKSLVQMATCTADVVQRNKIWLQQKESKIAKMKIEEEVERTKKEACSYCPVINQYRGEAQAHFSRFGKQGLWNFFERVTKKKTQTKENRAPNKVKEVKNYQQAVKDLHSRIAKMQI